MYAQEDYLKIPPTVEENRIATQQYLRTLGSYWEEAPLGQNNLNRQTVAANATETSSSGSCCASASEQSSCCAELSHRLVLVQPQPNEQKQDAANQPAPN